MLKRKLSKGAAVIAAAAILGIVSGASATDQNRMVSYINGQQAGTTSAGSGCGTFQLDRGANTLSYHIAYTGMTGAETAAHIHGPAGPGANAGVVHALPAGSPKVGSWTYPEAMENDIINGRMYVNIHSTTSPGGEIRGQISHLTAILNGAQQLPTNGTAAEGWATFTVDTTANTLSYHIGYDPLSSGETAAHIHGPAMQVGNAGVVHTLPAGNPKIGTWTYPQGLEANILGGCMYVNIHSAASPGGEIRGQISQILAPIDGGQAVPAVATGAAGTALFAIDPGFNLFSYYIEYSGLTGAETAAHIHGFAPAGANAGVVHALPAGQPKLGQWVYPQANEADIMAGRTYINIHTTTNPGGEIRGQITFGGKTPCPADLNGDGTVNAADLALLLGAWNGPGGDLTGDGTTNAADLAILLGAWGDCP